MRPSGTRAAARKKRARNQWTPRHEWARFWHRLMQTVASIGLALAVFLLALQALPAFYPDNAFHCTQTRVSAGGLLFASVFLVAPVSFVAVDVLLWLIPPARRAMDELVWFGNFAGDVRSTANFFLVMAAFLVPIGLLAAGNAVCMSQTAILYRAHSLAAVTAHPLSQIDAVRASCARPVSRLEARLEVVMRDGVTFDLLGRRPDLLWAHAPRVRDLLRGKPWDESGIADSCPNYARKLISAPR
jgi:hypothetical protein